MPHTSYYITKNEQEMLDYIASLWETTRGSTIRRLVIQEYTKLNMENKHDNVKSNI